METSRSTLESDWAAAKALFRVYTTANIPLENLAAGQTGEIPSMLNYLKGRRDERIHRIEELEHQRILDYQEITRLEEGGICTEQVEAQIRSSTPIPPMPPCPHPELEDIMICMPITTYEITRDFYGRIVYEDHTGKFFARYEDFDTPYLTIDEIRNYKVSMSHFFDKIDETGNRSMKFSRFLKFLSKHSRRRVLEAFRDLGLDHHIGEKIGPHLWPKLGQDEYEKVKNAKKVLEYVYCN